MIMYKSEREISWKHRMLLWVTVKLWFMKIVMELYWDEVTSELEEMQDFI